MEHRPNILLVCSDSHRFDYAGYAGADWIQTPNLDALASRGVAFDHCVSNCPVCIPARTALASGLAPHRFGAEDNPSTALPWPVWTMYQHLRDAGYWTAFTGKLHIMTDRFRTSSQTGDGRDPAHHALGFCDSLGLGQPMDPVAADTHPYTRYLHERGLLERYNEDRRQRQNDGQPLKLTDYAADTFLNDEDIVDTFTTRLAIERMAAFPHRYPWFHQVNLSSPHPPNDPCPAVSRRYRRAQPPAPMCDMTGKPRYLHESGREHPYEDVVFAQRQYAANVTELDAQIGRLVDALESTGQLDQTIIIYTSDHGEMLGDFHQYFKDLPYEPSIHVPLIVAGPGIQPTRSDAQVEWIDLTPTICDLAQTHPLPPIDGRSLHALLQGKTQKHRTDTLITHRRFDCLRTDRYKFIHNHNDLHELYDLHEDPREAHNLCHNSSDTPHEVLADLRHRLAKRLIAPRTSGQCQTV